MNNATLKQLLNEYEIKRSQAILIAEKKKEDFYKKNPRLQEIDRELCSFSLSTAKSILQTNNRDLLKDLKVKRSELLNEKEEIYQQSNISEKDFLPIFECSQCNDTGYITKDNKTEMCSCLKQKLFDLEFLQEKILKLLERFAILLYLILMILMIRIYFLLEILV